ncbi:hypothetical protein MMC17_004278 [Xylographa soralifera]|nr:hypothetical protein [Xylographa soralifera]
MLRNRDERAYGFLRCAVAFLLGAVFFAQCGRAQHVGRLPPRYSFKDPATDIECMVEDFLPFVAPYSRLNNWVNFAQYTARGDDLRAWCVDVYLGRCRCGAQNQPDGWPQCEGVVGYRYPMLDWCEHGCYCPRERRQEGSPAFSSDFESLSDGGDRTLTLEELFVGQG